MNTKDLARGISALIFICLAGISLWFSIYIQRIDVQARNSARQVIYIPPACLQYYKNECVKQQLGAISGNTPQ